MDLVFKFSIFLIFCSAIQPRHYYIHAASKDDDLITSLPGLTFDPGFKQYSGFLSVTGGTNFIHYWLVESQGNPATDPLVLWLNGGPGCSSLLGFFEELGPFFPNTDGTTLFENVFSWNKLANILFIESPHGVGYSYTTGGDYHYNDTKTAQENLEALIQFVGRFPEYNNRDFYITGESYGCVYVPTLALAVIQQIQADRTKLPLNLVGMAVGNGILSNNQQVNSFVDLAFYRGIIGKPQFNTLKSCCPNVTNLQYCDFSSWLKFEPDGVGYPNPDNSFCGNEIYTFSETYLWDLKKYYAYNMLRDCYTNKFFEQASLDNNFKVEDLRRRIEKFSDSPIVTDGIWRFINQGGFVNTISTDPFKGFPCYAGGAMHNYLHLAEVKTALHVPASHFNVSWGSCSSLNWTYEHLEMGDVFISILNSNYTLKILIYNGDTDGVCNFLGDEWFVENLAKNQSLAVTANRYIWWYQQQPGELQNTGGFVKKFSNANGSIQIDLLTIKGSGHQVPGDRPGPALAMLSNFLSSARNYSAPFTVSIQAKPLKQEYQTPPDGLLTRKQADQVFTLPGLTFDISNQFNHYSGYLRASPGNFLHYWLVTSSQYSNDPLIIWLSGGPGCTSVAALMSRHGPYHPNNDGTTLYQNIFSWNSAANVLYLSAPRNVGFSWQNTSINNDNTYNDDQTISDAYLAIQDFFSAYPEYIKPGQKFFIAGDGYSGIFVSGLAAKMAQDIKGLDHFTESRIFNYAKQYITPHFITEEHENDNEKN